MCNCKSLECVSCTTDFLAGFTGKMVAAATTAAKTQSYGNGYEDGLDIGKDMGHEEGRAKGYSEGYSIGTELGYTHGHAYGSDAGYKIGYFDAAGQVNEDSYEAGINFALETFADDINGNYLIGDIYNQGMEDGLSMVYDNAKTFLLSNGDLAMKVGRLQPILPNGFEQIGTMEVVVTYREPEPPKPKPKSTKKKSGDKKKSPKPKSTKKK